MGDISFQDFERMLNRIEDKIDHRLDNHSNRIQALERSWNKAYGVITLIAVFASAAASYIFNKLVGGN